MRRLRSFIVASCLLSTTWASACLWDYDTLAAEANGKMDYVEVIVGKFDRFPPLYYEMRLGNCIKQIDDGSKNLDLYDNAAVACDRLGRDDEAITWIERKRSLLPGLSGASQEVKDQWYRYYANAGTFWAHRWFANGAKAEKLSEVDRAVGFITKAIEVNPNAHFGREKVQLEVLKWAMKTRDPKAAWSDDRTLGGHLTFDTQLDPSEIYLGLSGLVRLGNAWESVDVFLALRDSLSIDELSSLADMARLRANELRLVGKSSMLSTKKGENFNNFDGFHRWRPDENVQAFNVKEFARLRSQSDEWQSRRFAFMMARLNAGRHPDWDKTFWNDWDDGRPFEVRSQPFWESPRLVMNLVANIALLLFVGIPSVSIAWILVKHFRAKKNLRKV